MNTFTNEFMSEVARESPWPEHWPPEITEQIAVLPKTDNNQENQQVVETLAVDYNGFDCSDDVIPIGDEDFFEMNNSNKITVCLSTPEEIQQEQDLSFSMTQLNNALSPLSSESKKVGRNSTAKIGKVLRKRLTKAEKTKLGKTAVEMRRRQMAAKTSRDFKQKKVGRAEELGVMRENLVAENEAIQQQYNTLINAYNWDFIINPIHRNTGLHEEIVLVRNNELEHCQFQFENDTDVQLFSKKVEEFAEKLEIAEKDVRDAVARDKEKKSKTSKKGKVEETKEVKLTTLRPRVTRARDSRDLNQLELDVLKLEYERTAHENIWNHVFQLPKLPIILELQQAVKKIPLHLSDEEIGIIEEVRGILETLDFG